VAAIVESIEISRRPEDVLSSVLVIPTLRVPLLSRARMILSPSGNWSPAGAVATELVGLQNGGSSAAGSPHSAGGKSGTSLLRSIQSGTSSPASSANRSGLKRTSRSTTSVDSRLLACKAPTPFIDTRHHAKDLCPSRTATFAPRHGTQTHPGEPPCPSLTSLALGERASASPEFRVGH
jgi:hypothetical protein